MKRPVRLLAAAAALQACVVSTDDLRPRTAADCQSFEKPCGYRCVPVNDPATGCGDPASCAPVDVQTDTNNCGVCSHYCTSCQSGLCAPEAITRTAGQLRGMAEKNGAIYWLETASGGQLVSWAPSMGAFAGATPATIVTNLDPRSGAPSLRRIASNPLHPELHVAGSSPAAPVAPLAVFAVDPVAKTSTPVCTDALAPSSVAVDGVVTTSTRVYFARSDSLSVDFCALSGASSGVVPTGSSSAIRGLGAVGDLVYYGYPDSGGTLARTAGATEEIVRSGVATVPHRVAPFDGGSGVDVYWMSEVDGSVSYLFAALGTPAVAFAGSGAASPADLFVDSHGLYWTERSPGAVWEWRNDGEFFKLADGVAPIGLAADVDNVYWTDDSGKVMRVPK